jgi:hypothetical protein
MADNILKVPASEQLRQIAFEEREDKPNAFEYSATKPNALSGDAKGKGDIGNTTDVEERSKLIAVNNYKDSNTYPDSSVV